jgi:hypothetical protein
MSAAAMTSLAAAAAPCAVRRSSFQGQSVRQGPSASSAPATLRSSTTRRAAKLSVSAAAGASDASESSSSGPFTATRRDLAKGALAAMAAPALAALPAGPAKADELSRFWEQVNLPLEPGVILLDIAFVESDPSHGFLTATRHTILETFDGGKSWDFKARPARYRCYPRISSRRILSPRSLE